MGFIVKETSDSKFPIIEAGVHQGVCVGILDLGTHYDAKWDKTARKCVFIWELPEMMIEIEKDGEKKQMPRVCSKQYTVSLSEKANLRKDLQSWRGRPFTAVELAGFDLKNVLGVNCMIQIIHVTKDTKIYANIESILPLYKGVENKIPQMDFLYFHMSEGLNIPEKTPKWIREIIESSKEFEGNSEVFGVDPCDDVPVSKGVPF